MRIERAASSFLMIVTLTSTDGSVDAVGLGNYLSRNVLGEIRRIEGVGSAQLFATQQSMRIWLDPDKMLGLKLTTMDVIRAVEAQNAQVAAGRIGAEPSPASQQISARMLVKGQLSTPDEFQTDDRRVEKECGSRSRTRWSART